MCQQSHTKCPSTGEWINKQRYFLTKEYYLIIKRNRLGCISKTCQVKKKKQFLKGACCVIACVWYCEKRKTVMEDISVIVICVGGDRGVTTMGKNMGLCWGWWNCSGSWLCWWWLHKLTHGLKFMELYTKKDTNLLYANLYLKEWDEKKLPLDNYL